MVNCWWQLFLRALWYDLENKKWGDAADQTGEFSEIITGSIDCI